MVDLHAKERRLAEWESICTDMVVYGSLRAWRIELLDEVCNMLTERLIDTGEAMALRERVELAYTVRNSIDRDNSALRGDM